ncbi:hypothetical protein AMTRI_Chr08g165840 [Amborella trichopoda]
MNHVEQLYAGCSRLYMHILRKFKNLGIGATTSDFPILWWKRDQFISVNLIMIFITQHNILEKKYFNMKRLIIINGIFCGFWSCKLYPEMDELKLIN